MRPSPTPPTLTGALAPFNPVVGVVSSTINQTRLNNSGVALDITVPDSASLSYYQKLNNKFDFLADVSWTGWSSIQEIRINRSNGTTLSVLPENFKDTWRFSVGTNYQYDDRVGLRAGVAYDQSPINNTDRGPRLPDNDRTWYSVGAAYNAVIAQAAGDANAALVDANALLKDLASNGIDIGGVTFTNSFLTGGVFSYDGVHPTPFGYAYVANAFIDAINAKYGSTIPEVDLYPYVFGPLATGGTSIAGASRGLPELSADGIRNLLWVLQADGKYDGNGGDGGETTPPPPPPPRRHGRH